VSQLIYHYLVIGPKHSEVCIPATLHHAVKDIIYEYKVASLLLSPCILYMRVW
jgi:hypothetical protein